MSKLVLIHDVLGTARSLFGTEICRHCVRMLRLAIHGRGEYIVPRCPRCGLAVDSRKIPDWRRTDIMNCRLISDAFRLERSKRDW